MTYYAARISFFRPRQILITPEETQEKPIILAEKFLITGPDHIKVHRISSGRRYIKGQIEFYIGDPLTEGSRLIAFKIGKRKLRTRGTHSKKHFGEVEEEHFPASTILWSAESQMIFIEKPKKDMMSIKSIIDSLQDYLNGALLIYGYSILIAPLTYKAAFWKVVDSYDKIYSVEFKLIAPNLFNFSDTAKDLVQSTKEKYNAQETSIKILNSKGDLLVKKEDGLVGSLLDWITSGAGKWIVSVDLNGKKHPINSDSASRTLDKDLPKYDAQTARDFTSSAADSMDNSGSDDE